ncbi:N-acetylmuramoyl-L-alanine amidase [Xanthomonas albilineans]|uniref:N-acetylmuramoyl-L-alanine amidase n=1 Tax=Xanthomonas albilineans (strain GPE PC73 / CFBP 7063) TaxID=380358 RepID=D2U8T4_XANAP|nr:N-acetylmuramoyl-L-alanine amidase [Xanthomonas albilineans]QHQ28701.1 putative n-acetylmuramoyl-l-alanine amidase protein [Xanthomonas albilineans]CBA16466.1 putative n-acetylmuramoyl-l-alanine amidase protein [Xanthomonas albilineans GPE PC73]
MPQIPPPSIHDTPLPYVERLEARALDAIELAVIHCTELPDLASARAYGERVLYPSGTGNSGHFYIDRDGSVYRYVPLQRVAHHVRGYNRQSLGIELVNRGRYPHWLDSRHQAMEDPYPLAQIQALIALMRQLQAELPQLRRIAGHETLDLSLEPASDDPRLQVRRKRDPGPLFPWTQVLAAVALTPYAPSVQ